MDVQVKKELHDLTDKLQPLMMKHRKEEERIDEIQKLKRRREKLSRIAVQESAQWGESFSVADVKFESLHEIDAAIAKLESDANENLDHIAAEVYIYRSLEQLYFVIFLNRSDAIGGEALEREGKIDRPRREVTREGGRAGSCRRDCSRSSSSIESRS